MSGAPASLDPGRPGRSSRRWVVLAAATAGQMSFSAFVLGLPSIAPAFREEYDASLPAIGAFLAVVPFGLVATLFVWGLATDRLGERLVMSVGIAGAAVGIGLASTASSFVVVAVLLTLAAAFGASVNSSSGKSIMSWFDRDQRGLALAVRQAGMMVAAAAAALTLPRLADAKGLHVALLALAVACLLGAAAAALFIRDGAAPETSESATLPDTLRDGRLWRLSIGSSFVCIAQAATAGFVVLFLHDARGLSPATAAIALAASQLVGGAIRIGSGVWSDRVHSRVVPLRRIAIASAITLAAAAAFVGAPIAVLFPLLILAGGISMGWNTVSFAAAAELGGTTRSGAALGLQQSVVGVTAALTPIPFALAVEGASWQAAWAAAAFFPLLGFFVLRALPVSEAYRTRRADRRPAAAETD